MRHAGSSHGNNPLQVGQVAQVFFLLNDNFLFNILRSCAWPYREHRNHSHFKIGNHLYRNAQYSNNAENHNDQYTDGEQRAATNNVFNHGYG